MDNRIGNAGGRSPHASSDEKSSKDRKDAINKNPGNAIEEHFDVSGEQGNTPILIDEQINPKEVISELRGALLSLEEIINNQENASPSSNNQTESRFSSTDRAKNGEHLKELSGLLNDITRSTPDQEKMQEIQARLNDLVGEDLTPDLQTNPKNWTHSGRTFSSIKEVSAPTHASQSFERTEPSNISDAESSFTSNEQSLKTDHQETSEDSAAVEHNESATNSDKSKDTHSIGFVAGGVLLTGRVALGIITGGTVTLIDGGRDVYLGTRDGVIDKAATGASKLASGAAILIGITSANPALLAGGAIIYSGSLLYEYRETIASLAKRSWDWFKF